MNISPQGSSFEFPARGPRARTARLMLETAVGMMQAGTVPSVTEVAEKAGVSRATAYRYFPSQAALVHAVVDQALGPILDWSSKSADAGKRVEALLRTSLPRIADYHEVLAGCEVWLAEGENGLDAVLVLEIEPTDFTIWSIAVAPPAAGRKLGAALMAFAEARARALGYGSVHLYTHAKLARRIGWYERLGFAVTHHEDLADRRLTHMRKTFAKAG